MDSEECKTTLNFLEKIPVYVIVVELGSQRSQCDYFSLTLECQRSH